jgi:IclR family transcriptional regulator, KDG regulon repressor
LREAGYVIYDEATKKYALGFKLVDLAGKVQHRRDVKSFAEPFLARLSRTLDEDIALNILIEGRRVCIALVESRYFVRQFVPLGQALPAHCSAAGKVLLAHLPAAETNAVIDRYGLPRFTKSTITQKKRLLAQLARIRDNGYAESRAEYGADSASLAFPIVTRSGRVVASLSIQSTVNRLTDARRPRFLEEGRRAAARIGELLAG